MGYKFFDKKYLVMPDEKDIIGKKVFYSDHLDALVRDVESGDSGKAKQLDAMFTESNLPFDVNGAYWGLAYHDPNYEAKVAYSQGRKIQYSKVNGVWVDAPEPRWYEDGKYRIAPEPGTRRYTNRELAEWVADNRGQILKRNRMVSVSYYYLEGYDDAPVPGNVKIRAWSETDWHEPLVEVKE